MPLGDKTAMVRMVLQWPWGTLATTRAGRRAAVRPRHLGIGPEFVAKNQIDDAYVRQPAEPGGALG
jgi:hypothetical protein